MAGSGSQRSTIAFVAAAVGAMLLVWVLAMPRSAGPDEPSHQIRAGALVRGQLDGQPFEPPLRAFDLPAEIGFPDPGCYAFQPSTPASCIADLEPPPGEATLLTKSNDYPIWGHLLPGLGTFAPGSLNTWATRLLDALIPALLVVASLAVAARRGWLAAGATLLAVTPMAWFTFAVVNPSGLVIAGGLGLWTALVALQPGARPSGRLVTALATASWVAMALPRRDGLVYVALILSAAILIFDLDVRELARRLGRASMVIIAIATFATLAWAWRSETTSSNALLVAPLAPVGAALLRRWARHPAVSTTRGRVVALAALLVVGVAGVFVVMSRRSGGFDRAALRGVIGQTGVDLTETVGVLGWQDTPVPTTAVFAVMLALGGLVALCLVGDGTRALVGASAIVMVSIVVAWTLTMLQNSPDGLYWQGRYYLPFLAGVPIVLATVDIDARSARRVGLAVAGVAVVVANIALAQAMRRFGVGVSGSLVPTDWNTYGSPVPPAALLLVHAAASVGLLVALRSLVASRGATSRIRGVNVVGYHHVNSGLGEIAREVHRSLEVAGVPCSAIDVAATDSPRRRDPMPPHGPFYDTTIAVVPALQLPSAMNELPEVTAAHDRLIGYFFWELAIVPETHRQALELVDETWLPTRFVYDAYGEAIDEWRLRGGARLMPTYIERPDVSIDIAVAWRESLLDHGGATVFLVSFDLFSVIERKNPMGAITAFRQAFDGLGPDSVVLVIKTMNGDQRPDDLQRIKDAVGDDDRMIVLDRHVTEAEHHALIAAADVYVSLHRSEGLGLQIASAMWSGTPVIATRYSGVLDLVDDECAALVDAGLVPVEHGEGAYPADAEWADPDVDQAATWMGRLAEDADLRRSFADAARQRMLDQPARWELGRAMAEVVANRHTRIGRSGVAASHRAVVPGRAGRAPLP